jgi:hypothetical protein
VDVIADMMAKNPAERTASANDVAERLAPWAEGLDQALAGAKGAVSAGGPGSLQWTLRPAYAGQPSEVEPGLEETQASVSAIPDVPATTEESSGQVSQTTYPVAESAEETHHTVHLAKPVPEPPLAILAPFAALVLFPLAVVALILLAWWISRIMF